MTNVYVLAPRRGNRPITPSRTADTNAFDNLTDLLLMKQAAVGTLNPVIVAALLAAVWQPVGEGGR
jgi:hypothetical protein